MKIEYINDVFSVSGHLIVEGIQSVADDGVPVIVCNRSDGEAGD